MKYLVTWEIDIEADSSKDAAVQAFEIMQREGTTATVFYVADRTGFTDRIDLLDGLDSL